MPLRRLFPDPDVENRNGEVEELTKMTTSLSKGDDPRETAARAAAEALEKLGCRPDLCMMYASTHYDTAGAVEGIRSVIGQDVQIIGCSSSGEFTETAVEHGSIAIGLISSDSFSFQAAARSGLRNDTYALFDLLYRDVKDIVEEAGTTSVIMLIDGFSGRGEEAVFSAFTTFDVDAHIVGGSASGNLDLQTTRVIANETILTDGVSICVIKGGSPFITSVHHGHTPISDPLIATKTRENVIQTINNRPAWDVWKEKTREKALLMGIDPEKLSEKSEIARLLITFELGLLTEEGYKIRVPLSKNGDGSINFACTIPEGTVFRIMGAERDDQIRSAGEAARRAREELGNRKAVGALVFDCCCRAVILEDRFREAVHAIRNELPGIPILGFETLGEICMNPARLSGFHNTTTVIVLIAE